MNQDHDDMIRLQINTKNNDENIVPDDAKNTSGDNNVYCVTFESKPYGFRLKPYKSQNNDAIIKSIINTTLSKSLSVGSKILQINDISVESKQLSEITDILRNAELPVNIKFYKPNYDYADYVNTEDMLQQRVPSNSERIKICKIMIEISVIFCSIISSFCLSGNSVKKKGLVVTLNSVILGVSLFKCYVKYSLDYDKSTTTKPYNTEWGLLIILNVLYVLTANALFDLIQAIAIINGVSHDITKLVILAIGSWIGTICVIMELINIKEIRKRNLSLGKNVRSVIVLFLMIQQVLGIYLSATYHNSGRYKTQYGSILSWISYIVETVLLFGGGVEIFMLCVI